MTTRDIAFNAICTAAVAGAATYFVFNEYDTVNYFGMSVSSPVAVGVGCGIGSVVSDLTSEYVIKKIGVNDQIVNGSTLAVQAGVGGTASAAALYFGGLPFESIPSAFILGAGSKLGGDYVNKKVFDPITGFIPLF